MEILLMFTGFWGRRKRAFLLPTIAVALSAMPMSAQAPQQPGGRQDHPATSSLHWESAARMHRANLIPGDHGTLQIDQAGVEFRATNEHRLRWTFGEIRAIFIAPHRLVVETYLNRSLHRPGVRKYRFDFTQTLPPDVAESVAEAVGRPSQNADPEADAPAFATIPVRHRAFASGTNGVLRFRQDGIDYVTASREDSRSWRWADLQTLSDPDPYHLFVFGYRDTYTFDLNAPLSRKLLDWAADEIFMHNEPMNGPVMTAPNGPESDSVGDHHE
jgi:hypothetical protein